ncbi:MAG: hypothetical protein GC181_13055 [Bacteroidetes bacterium]|nr:hypothetical protein [Bacteroidota bacterium]
MKDLNDIMDDAIRSAFADFEGSVPTDSWEKISGILDGDKKRPLMWWWVAACFFIVFSGIGIFIHLNSEKAIESARHYSTKDHSNRVSESSKEIISHHSAPINNQVESDFNYKPHSAQEHTSEFVVKPKIGDKIQLIDSSVQSVSINYSSEQIGEIQNAIDHPELRNADEILKAIFNASVIGANDSYNIPTTINNGLKQKDSSFPQDKGKWDLGLSASPALAGLMVRTNGKLNGLLNKNYNKISENGESFGFSYQVGVSANRYITKNIYFGFGLKYDVVKESTHYDYIIDSNPEFNLAKSKITGYTARRPEQIEHVQHNGNNEYQFLEVPLKFGIVVPVVRNRWDFRSEMSLQYMYMLNKTGSKVDPTYLELTDLKSDQNYNRQNLGTTLNIGMYRYVKSNLQLGVIPYYQIAFNSIRNNQSVLKDRPISYGFNVSAVYLIRRRLH